MPPSRAPNQIFVANHTSLIDIAVLMQWQVFAAVGQKHVGFVGFMQDYVLRSLGCLWFERNEQKERLLVAKRYANVRVYVCVFVFCVLECVCVCLCI